MKRLYRCSLLFFALLMSINGFADKWQPINPEELKLTSVNEAPGANAVILYREYDTDDVNASDITYERIKILTEEGRKYADVELPFDEQSIRVNEVKGRTIHPDGSIVEWTGKPLTKDVMKAHGIRIKMKTITLPDVTVGSIIEYRYVRNWDREWLYPTVWELQRELFTKHVKMTLKSSPDMALRWNVRNLPSGVKPDRKGEYFSLEMDNVPAFEKEENMPPKRQMSMNIYFYYGDSDMTRPAEYWKNKGHEWAKDLDHFASESGLVKQTAAQTVQASDTPEQKLRRLYARAQQIRNLTYERDRSDKEAKEEHLDKSNSNADAVLKRGYGWRRDINRTFIALARAAGFDATGMRVAERDSTFFDAGILSVGALNREIAVVKLDGNDVYLDPGTKYCPYGVLDWKLTSNGGIRQVNGGETMLAKVPPMQGTDATTVRVSELTLDADGNLSGTLIVRYKGVEALTRRLNGLEEDEAAHKRELEDEAKSWLATAGDVELKSLSHWEDEDSPIEAEFNIRMASFASSAGSRLLMPTRVFDTGYRRAFDHKERKFPIYYDYPFLDMEEVHIHLPKGVKVESVPEKRMEKDAFAAYLLDRQADGNTIILKRQLIVGGIFFPVDMYPKMKTFFDGLKTQDEEQVILKSTESSSLIGGTDAR